MKPKVLAATLVGGGMVLVAAALAAGYWLGANRPLANHPVEPATQQSAAAADAAPAAAGERKILYYRNPMGLPDTSPVPKKDQMGMDYIPVYADEEEPSDPDAPTVKISPDKVQKLGVRTQPVSWRDLGKTVRAVATVQANERLLHTVAPRFEGWIQRLYVNTSGQPVRRGEPLMDVYSPELITAQQEYLIARRGVEMMSAASPELQDEMQRLMQGALVRLRNWDISEAEISRLEKEGKMRQHLTLRSPASGVVLEKEAIQGKRFMAGEVLYQIADLSTVWLLAEVFEQDLSDVKVGQAVQVTVDAYPGKNFSGRVTFIYPTLNVETRTAKVRLELANRGGLLKPAMYAQADFASAGGRARALTVPDSAVLDTGMRQLVLVERGEGRFQPRQVKLGRRGDGFIEVLEGVSEGEKVVVSANFLIDAESNLKAALGAFGQHGEARAAAGKATHRGEGTVQAIDAANGRVTLAHDPIASLNWPAMTMDFKLKDPALARELSAGKRIAFDIEDAGGQWLITAVKPAAAGSGRRP